MNLALVKYISLALLFAALIANVFAFYVPVQIPYHPLNTDWNGCSEAASIEANTTILFSYKDGLPIGRGSLLAIMGPGINFTRNEASLIREFSETGGVVLLADNLGTGNSLLAAMNMSVKIAGKPLADLYFYSKNPEFPIIRDFSLNAITTNLTALVLNHPSYLIPGNANFTVLAWSSPFSFLDLGQGRPLLNETVASYPVIGVNLIGAGAIVIIADPNIFTNGMIGLYDNKLLLHNLLTGSNHLIIDAAHFKTAPLTSLRIKLKQQIDSALQYVFVNRSGLALQWVSLIVIILGFSFEIARRIRKLRWI